MARETWAGKAPWIKVIADIVGVKVEQLPELTSDDFGVSQFSLIEHYKVKDQLMAVWKRLGANVVCPVCHRYATQVFFQRGRKLPTVFRCGYQNTIWYDYDVDDVLVGRILRRYNAKLWCE